ncbi:DUF3307 domain-containing protein [Halalkalibacillus halophilus]|uniref:DUF3307 domain-containing protein n=1 Tax=Halalkalibacillus halophilus TaxID=392827 RepID=UPI00068866E5|nr:DUF3307 domain-containing protein [Halalkalibacillus halophilus]
MIYFLLILLGHFISDFVLQSNKMIDNRSHEKSKIRHTTLIKHVGIHLIVYNVLLLVWILVSESLTIQLMGQVLFATILILLLHYMIDWLKVTVNTKFSRQRVKVFSFIIDQLLHIIVITVVLHSVNLLNIDSFIGFTISEKIIAVIILILINTLVAGRFLSIVLEKIAPPNSSEHVVEEEVDEDPTRKIVKKSRTYYPDSDYQLGRYIGMLERILISMFVVANSVMGVTVLLAIKSLTRFKQFEDRRFAEYYLIGTLISIIIAIAIGYVARIIIMS